MELAEALQVSREVAAILEGGEVGGRFGEEGEGPLGS